MVSGETVPGVDFLIASRAEQHNQLEALRLTDNTFPAWRHEPLELPLPAVEDIIIWLIAVRLRPGMYMGWVNRECLANLFIGFEEGFRATGTKYPRNFVPVAVKKQGYYMSGSMGVDNAVAERFPEFTEVQVVDAVLAIHIYAWELYRAERLVAETGSRSGTEMLVDAVNDGIFVV